jgi:hypothetical protein
MNKWLMLVALVLMVLVSAIGLRNLQANQAAVTTPIVASTGSPVPVMPPPTKGGSGSALFASTGSPVPVMPPPTKGGGTALFASTGSPVPVMPPPTKGGGSGL